MNIVGVVLSAMCLLTALIELKLRADLSGRRMGAFLAAAAWTTMATVAWDQTQKCYSLEQKNRHLESHQHEAKTNQPKQETADQSRGPIHSQQ